MVIISGNAKHGTYPCSCYCRIFRAVKFMGEAAKPEDSWTHMGYDTVSIEVIEFQKIKYIHIEMT